MARCSPQRFLANNRNLARDAVLTVSSVLPVEQSVLTVPTAHVGTAQVKLSGAYSGDEAADYDVQIVGTTPIVPRISSPVFAGAGSGQISDIVAIGLPAQQITIELADVGQVPVRAAVAFEGVRIEAKNVGAYGNQLRISIDQSGLTYSSTPYSLLVDLEAGKGGEASGLEGAAFDWDTAVVGADNLIPAAAHRIAFGDDAATIYLQYKRYVDNKWEYHFVPEIKRLVPRGTPVKFVTGGRTVTVADGSSPDETYTGIATVYDILSAIKTQSAILRVDGIVANDRTPEGQASRELLVRTDAHVEQSTGTGSGAATGFIDAFATGSALTELVTAKCYAVTSRDHSLARLGAERWEVKGSLSGKLADAVTGTPYATSRFGFTIPRRLPPGYGTPRGKFSVIGIDYVARGEGIDPPGICPGALTLGTEAVDQTLVLVWTKRPSGECDCKGMPFPKLGGACLGIFEEGTTDMAYSNANRERLKSLYQWYADRVRQNSASGTLGGAQDPFLSSPTGATGYDPRPLREMVTTFESVLAQLNELAEGESPDLRGDGEAAWDDAVTEMQADIDATDGDSPSILNSALTDRYLARLNQVLITAGISPLGKVEASAVESGDGCWRDWGDAYYFTVTGSVKGEYAPLFVNHPYYSAARATDQGRYFSTKEFALQVNVVPDCVDQLLEGDRVTLAIGDAGYPGTYQVGDELTLPVIGAQPLFLVGGQDGSDIQTWYVTGSVQGPFAPFLFEPGSPVGYSDAGLSFDIAAGGVPFKQGDRWTFSIEGGTFRWRKNAGAWTSAADIPATPAAFDEGLSIEFVAGAAPSFSAGDTYSFRALQPWAASNIRTPTPSRWQWADESPGVTLEIDLGSTQAVDAVALARHTIPEGATITLQGGTIIGVFAWSEAVTWRADVIAQPLSQARSARYLRLTLVDADGGGIGWLWAGTMLATELSADVSMRRAYRVQRSEGPLNEGGNTLAKTVSGEVTWTEAALSQADFDAIVALIDHVKDNDDEPFIVVPHVDRPEEAMLVRVVQDEVDFAELSSHNRNQGSARRYGGTLPLAGVWR